MAKIKVIYYLFSSFILLPSFLLSSFPSEISGPILYRMHQGDSEKAFSLYLDYAKQSGNDDYELLHQACIRLLEGGAKSQDPETKLMAMFGAGIAANPSLIPLLEKGLHSGEMRAQVVALHFLADLEHDEADSLLQEALSSPSLLLRLEAAFELAQKKEETILEQLQALYYKVPEEIHIAFPQIIAPIDTPGATKFLEKLLNHPKREVRINAALEAGIEGRDDLTPRLRYLASQTSPAEQEAAIHSLALLKDEESKPLMRELAEKKKDNCKLAALEALYRLDETEVLNAILEEARSKNLFAIALLGSLSKEEKSITLLKELAANEDATVSLNAVISLFEAGIMPPHELLKMFLIHDERDLGFFQMSTPGKTLHYWTAVTGVASLAKIYPTLSSESAQFKLKILKKALELPEEQFLEVARLIFTYNQTDLVPAIIELLMNCHSKATIALLQEMQQKAGAPTIRNYCSLALFRMNVEGPYEDSLLKWVGDSKNHPLIRLKEEKKDKKNLSRFELTPEETSQLLLSVFEALATKHNEKGRTALIRAIAYGNPKNKYALAGLLMRMTE